MYWAIILAFVAMLVWPERNILDTPFSELTLGLIFKTVFGVWMWYCVIKVGFSSFEKDTFWPWRWNKRVITLLAMRGGWLALIALGVWGIMEHKKFGELAENYSTIFLAIIFIAVTSAICMPDEQFIPAEREKQNDQQA